MTDGPRRLTDTILPWFAAAFASAAPGEDFVWDVSLMTVPSGPDQFVTAVSVYIEMPSAVLGETLCNTAVLQPSAITESYAGQVVKDMLGSALQARSQRLVEAKAGGNGRPPSGLVLPGA